MSNHNYSQYSNNNNKKKKNYNKHVVEETIVENVMVSEVETMTVEPTVPEVISAVEPLVETVETVALPDTIVGTIVNCAKLNIRSKPTAEADVLTVLEANSEVKVDTVRSSTDWLKITTATGVDGFCMRKFVSVKM